MLHAVLAWLTLIGWAGVAPVQNGSAQSRPGEAGFVEAGTAFVRLLSEQDVPRAAAMISPLFRGFIPTDTLRQVWPDKTREMGALRRFGKATCTQVGWFEAVFVPIEFERGRARMKVVLAADRSVVGFFWVPPGIRSAGVRPAYLSTQVIERDVTVTSGPWGVGGTLCLPASGTPRAGFVFVHGSGAHDRDETIGPNKPLRDLALGLAAHGIASLRYEKRTHAHPVLSALSLRKITVKEEVIDDALAALACLRQQKEVEGAPVLLLGHSLGAMLAGHIAAEGPPPAGVVLLAGPARPIADIVLEQTGYLLSLSSTAQGKSQEAAIEAQIDRLRRRECQAGEMVIGAPASYWYDLAERDGAAAVRATAALKCPILVLQGGRDYQVTLEDYHLWQEGLKGHPAATFKLFDDLNHLLAAGEGKSTPGEYADETHIDPRVIEAIAEWCLTETRPGASSREQTRDPRRQPL